VRKQISK